MRRVAVTGLGVVSSIGTGAPTFFDALLAGRSGVRRLTPRAGRELPGVMAAEVSFDPEAHFPKPRLGLLDRVSQFALIAAREAVAQSGLLFDDTLRARTGVSIGTGMGGNGTVEAGYEELFLRDRDRLAPYTVVRTMHNAPAAQISLEFGLRGPTLTYSNACSSSAVSIGESLRAIRHGYADCILAGGSEALLTLGTLRAWEAMRAMARPDALDVAASCRPFSADRDGLVLGEGAAVLVLEAWDFAVSRGASILAELAGYGIASDAVHIAQPDAAGQLAAMRLALSDANISPTDIDYINAHGTATQAGDVTEAEAIRDVLGPEAERVAVSATKSLHGHLMGAAGAIEAATSVLAIVRGALPPTAHLRISDPRCRLNHVANVARLGVRVRAALSNSFAFGGSNAVLAFRAH